MTDLSDAAAAADPAPADETPSDVAPKYPCDGREAHARSYVRAPGASSPAASFT